MGRERQLPVQLGQIHSRYGTPFLAVLASAVVMLIAVVVVPLRVVGNLASLFSLRGFIIVNVSVIRLRRQKPNLSRPFTIPYYPYPPLLGIALNLLLGLFISPRTWAIALGWLVFGAIVYVAWDRWSDRQTADQQPVSDADQQPNNR